MASQGAYNPINPQVIQQMLASMQRTREGAGSMDSNINYIDQMMQQDEMDRMLDELLGSTNRAMSLTHSMNQDALTSEEGIAHRNNATELAKSVGAVSDELAGIHGLPMQGRDVQAQAMRGHGQSKDMENVARASDVREDFATIGNVESDGQTLDDILAMDGETRRTPIKPQLHLRPDNQIASTAAGAVTDAAEINRESMREVQQAAEESSGEDFSAYVQRDGVMGRQNTKQSRGSSTRATARETQGGSVSTTRRANLSQIKAAIEQGKMEPVQDAKGNLIAVIDKATGKRFNLQQVQQ